jgi:hypothetical protein
MVDDDNDAKKDESDKILKRKELLDQLKKPFFDPGVIPPVLAETSTQYQPRRKS